MFAPWKKIYDQPLQHIKKQRYYFAKKVHLVKAMVFPVVMYECESWTVKEKKNSLTISTVLASLCNEMMEPDAMIFIFLKVEF